MIYANRGMLLESLIERTAGYYAARGRAWIEKRAVPIKIVRTHGDGTITGYLQGKSTADYVGLCAGRHLDFEAKSTKGLCFNLAMVKKHQLAHLQTVARLGAECFVLVYMETADRFFRLELATVLSCKSKRKGTLDLTELATLGRELFIATPGILDFLGGGQTKNLPTQKGGLSGALEL